MKADFSRQTFDPAKRFSAVLMQQGRVALDADWNEQGAILLRQLRQLAADLIGPAAGPAGHCAFALSSLPGVDDFRIGSGRYYVDGILCEVDASLVAVTSFEPGHDATVVEVEAWSPGGVSFRRGQWLEAVESLDGRADSTLVRVARADRRTLRLALDRDLAPTLAAMQKPALRHVTTYLTQPDLQAEPLSPGTYVAYLDVWERLITHLEDPSIRDLALGGTDTAVRAKTVWQLKLTPATEDPDTAKQACMNALHGRSRGRLAVTTRKDPADRWTPSRGGYRGEENRLYRVEVHRGTDDGGAATFKWSRANGAETFAILRGGGTGTLVLADLGGDHVRALAEGDWVEVDDDDSVLQNRRGPLLRVRSVAPGSATVVLAGTPDPSIGAVAARHPLLRRWGDPAAGGAAIGRDGAALISHGEWIELEDGIKVEFAGTTFCTGDYWVIPARTATADVEWPLDTEDRGDGEVAAWPASVAPHGVAHHHAPLALIEVAAARIRIVQDYRREFPTLAR